MRLASGLAPVSRYLEAGVPVGLGVDGSASNDSSHLMGEARQALLLNRLGVSPGIGSGEQMTARQALGLATVGGAGVLGRDDIGRLAPGMAADVIAFDLNRVEYAGALHDPVAAVVMCSPVIVDHSWVAGRRVVEDRRVVGLDATDLIREQNRLAASLL
jgi:cytosine/adenosine deaminase-related metal-dependent hydrolase